MPIKYSFDWAIKMTVKNMQDRINILDKVLQGRTRRGLKPVLKKQRQEIIEELEKRGVLCQIK